MGTRPRKEILVGDCREQLKKLPDDSIDSIVTDPPYELGFMGKKWDASGVAYDAALWTECLRVLKPGGHLLAFGGTRTYHRMAVAIEDAGFEIRDSVHWVYGSGFPKSLDVSKAIDKAAGADREVVGTRRGVTKGDGGRYNWHTGDEHGATVVEDTAPATDDARRWSGWGTALKPAHEPIVVARKPLVGTVAGNVLAHGTGALNIDGCRVGSEGGTQRGEGGGWLSTQGAFTTGHEVVSLNSGRWPANLVLTHSADCADACAPDCPVAVLDGQSGVSKDGVAVRRNGTTGGTIGPPGAKPVGTPDMGYGGQGGASRFFTVTEWDEIDVPFRYVAKPGKKERNAGLDGLPKQVAADVGAKRGRCQACERWADAGEGSNCGKCGAEFERTSNAPKPQSNTHPTVKPVALMRWLVRLVTPKGGTVLDPFLGSGTTAVAAILEGFEWKGCEMTADYLPIIEGRVTWAEKEREKATAQPTLLDEAA